MVVVVGMARSGLAAARLLRDHGVDVFATDRDPTPALREEFERIGVPHEVGRHSPNIFCEAEEIIVSPGVPLDIEALVEARRRGIPIIGELEAASRHLRGSIVAVTGSNGKTTTTALITHILKRGPRPVEAGGNIGIPATDLAARSREDGISVLEVSSFQIEGIQRFRPDAGVLLNITPDHLDRYRDFEAYRRAKFELFRNQEEDDLAILNHDDPQVFPPPVQLRALERGFSVVGRVAGGAGCADGMLWVGDRPILALSDSPLRGWHNTANILAALLVGDRFGIPDQDAAEAVRTFRGVEHRLETVATVEGVEFVNDSKATNVDAAVKAIEACFGPEGAIILIAGGKAKGSSFEPMVSAMAGRVRRVLAIGAAAGSIEAAVGGRTPVDRAGSMRDAVRRAFDVARPGDLVLLAPACASFDMYANYEERGRDFKNEVQLLRRRERS